MADLLESELTRSIIGAFFAVYNGLGFGFLEHVYVLALEQELVARGHQVGREVRVPVFYKGVEIAQQRLDMVVNGKIVIEVKAGFELHKAAPRQLHSYLANTPMELGLLLHFGPEPRFFRVIFSNDRKSAKTGLGPRKSA